MQTQLEAIDGRIGEIDRTLVAQTEFGEQLRRRHADAAARAAQLATIERDRETLVTRLLALRGQYADDLRKLVFADEAGRLLDPLHVVLCPSCFQSLPERAANSADPCRLCGRALPAPEADVDLSREVRATNAKLRQLNAYIEDVEAELSRLKPQVLEAGVAHSRAQADLDAAVAESVAPFLAERDQTSRDRQGVERELAEVHRRRQLRSGLGERRVRVDEIAQDIAA